MPAKGKGPAAEEIKKIKLKPLSSKETKNWKNRIADEDEDDFDLPLDEIENFENEDFDDFDEDDDRF